MAIQAGATKVHVEVNNKGIATMLNDMTKNLLVAGPIIEDIKRLL